MHGLRPLLNRLGGVNEIIEQIVEPERVRQRKVSAPAQTSHYSANRGFKDSIQSFAS